MAPDKTETYSPSMDADVTIQMGQVVDVDELILLDQERSTKAAFELRNMLGNGLVDFGRILGILEGKVAN